MRVVDAVQLDGRRHPRGIGTPGPRPAADRSMVLRTLDAHLPLSHLLAG